jgi:IS5 family transposase
MDAESVSGHLLPQGSVYAFLAEHRRELFPDAMFADLFPSPRGRPSEPADVVAAVLVLQALEGRSDREATEALTFDLRWKAACGLPVGATAFHPTVLTYWRRRLAASARPQRIFDAVREVVQATGALSGKTRRALDSTVLEDAVATQDTVTQLVASIRRVARTVPGGSELVAATATAAGHDYARPGKPAIAWDDEAARAALVDGLVRDARAVLAAIAAGAPPTEGAAADAVGLLALVAGQDVEHVPDPDDPGGGGRWRIARRVAADRVISTVDPDARHAHKTVHRRLDGFTAHVVVEPDTGLITATALTPANAGDGPTGIDLLAGETTSLQVLADSAYGSGEVRAALSEAGHHAAIKAIPLRRNPRLGPDQFNRDDFDIDHTAGTVTCPGGHTVTISRTRIATFGVRCRDCPLRSRCTSATDGRSLNVHTHDAELTAARAAWAAGDFAEDYRRHRPMVERSIAWLVTKGNRRVRYRGLQRNQHGLAARVAAINLRRLVNLGLDHHQGTWRLA